MKPVTITPSSLTHRLMFRLIAELHELSDNATANCWETVVSEMQIEKQKVGNVRDVTIVLAFVPSVRACHPGLAVRLLQKCDNTYTPTHLIDPEKGGREILLWHNLNPTSPLVVGLADELAKSIGEDEQGNKKQRQTPWQIHSNPSERLDCDKTINRMQKSYNQKAYNAEMEYLEKYDNDLPMSTKPMESASHRPTTFTIGSPDKMMTCPNPGILIPVQATDPVLILDTGLNYQFEPSANVTADSRVVIPIEVYSYVNTIVVEESFSDCETFKNLLAQCPKRLGDDIEAVLGFNPARNGNKAINVDVSSGTGPDPVPTLVISNAERTPDDGVLAFSYNPQNSHQPIVVSVLNGLTGAERYEPFQAMYGLDITNVVGATAWFKDVTNAVMEIISEYLN